MAQNFRQTISVQGDGAPTDGDGLSTNLAIFPIGRIYIDSETATLYVRNTDVGVAADWVEGGGGPGSSSLLPTTGTGTATGAVIGSLDGNTLNIAQGANSFLALDPTANAESATLQAYNTTGSDNSAVFQAVTTNLIAEADISVFFNGGAKAATIELLTDTTTSTIDYTADEHIFTGIVTAGIKDNHVTGFQAMSSAIKAELIGTTFSQMNSSTANLLLADGDIRWLAAFLPTDATLTGIKFWLMVACVSSGNTMSKVGLYTSDGTTLTRVAQSNNNANLFKGTTDIMHDEPFSGTYAATRGLYYIAYLHNPTGETTIPEILKFENMSTVATSGMDFTTGDMHSGVTTGNTDLPATQLLSGITKSNIRPYVAAY